MLWLLSILSVPCITFWLQRVESVSLMGRRVWGTVLCTAFSLRLLHIRAPGRAMAVSRVTGKAPGPFPVGVTTMQLDDLSRKDQDGPRSLQTEIWYPAAEETRELPRNRFSEFLGRGVIPGSIEAAEAKDAIGGSPGLQRASHRICYVIYFLSFTLLDY